MNLSERVKELRTDPARLWSQETLAAKAGVSAKTVRNLEAGQGVHLSTARRIAAALGVSLDQLFPAEEKAS